MVLCLTITLGLHLSPYILTILKIVQTNKRSGEWQRSEHRGLVESRAGSSAARRRQSRRGLRLEPGKHWSARQKKTSRSLSQEVEHRLDGSIRRDYEHNRDRHIRGLAEAIAILTHWVERGYSKALIDDPFTAEALRRGIEFLVFHFGAPGTPEVPASVKDAAARMPYKRVINL